MHQCILLDRDGVINYDSTQYIKSVREFEFIPGALEAISILSQAGYKIGVATNQSGIARSLYTEDTLHDIHQHMVSEIIRHGGHIDAIRYCPHMPDAGCLCRKPQPGMLMSLLEEFGQPDTPVYFLGDRITDLEAAKEANLQSALICSPMTYSHMLSHYPSVSVYSSLLSWVKINVQSTQA